MKLKILTTVFFMMLISSQVFSNENDNFGYDKKAIDKEFSELNQMENIVNENQNLTYNDLSSKGLIPAELKAINFNMSSSPLEPPLGIPGFWWGCVLGPIGILIAYFVSDNDKTQAKSALTGCIVGYGSVALIYAIIYVVFFATFWGASTY